MTANGMETELHIPISADFPQKVADFMDACLAESSVDVPARQETRLHIAADEVASNLMAYSGATEVLCRFAAQNGEVMLTFSDNGISYDPLAQDVPDVTASAEDRSIGGLGLLLVQRMMSAVHYTRSNDQNILTLQLCW